MPRKTFTPLQMTVRTVTLRERVGVVELERDNGPIQGRMMLTMPLSEVVGLFPGDTMTLTYSQD